MPCASSTAYNVSFSPDIDEFHEYRTEFTNKFISHFAENEYILVPEKGKQSYYTHLQGWIGYKGIEKRADSVRKSFHTKIMKNIEINELKIGLKLTPITRDVKLCQGYVLKECGKGNFKDVVSNLSREVLLDCQSYYLHFQENKQFKGDKVRVNNRNLFRIFKKYFEEKYYTKKPMIKIGREEIMKALSDMAYDGYWIAHFFERRVITGIINKLWYYMNNELEQYISIIDGEQQTIEDDTVSRARNNPY